MNTTDQPLSVEEIRCPGCETSQQWADFDTPPEDVDALGTCPVCGTHILGFDTVTEDELEELTVFFDSLVDPHQSDDRANGEIIS